MWEQIATVHLPIGDAYMVARFWIELPADETLIWRLCDEGKTILGRYLRNEPARDFSDELQRWKKALDDAYEELDRRADEQEQQ